MAGLLFHILRMSASQRLKKCHYCHDLLIGGMEHLLFFHILRRIVPTDFHIFQRGRYTTNQISIPLVRKKSSLPPLPEGLSFLDDNLRFLHVQPPKPCGFSRFFGWFSWSSPGGGGSTWRITTDLILFK